MRENPERIAWIVLWSAFGIFILLLVSTPYLVYTTLTNSERVLSVSATLTSGIVLLNHDPNSPPEALINIADNVRENTRFETSPASQTAIVFNTPNGSPPDTLGTLQLYGDTEATLRIMRTPRFDFSTRNHRLIIELQRGRARIDLVENGGRLVEVTIETPQASITLDRSGSYSLEVNSAETQVTVREGIATVTAQGNSLTLGREERTYVRTDSAPAGVQSGTRNLITNGDFQAPLSNGWTVFQNRSAPDAKPGELETLNHSGRQALHFARFDNNWAELGIRQELNRDVRDYESLKLQLAVWLAEHSLYNCGSLGSECPVMVRLEYTDNSGTAREWLQGFFYNTPPFNIDPPVPTRCVTCPPPSGEHQLVQRGVWFFYDSPELLSAIREVGFEVVRLDAITIYASGHNFESYVAEVALLAQE